MAPFLLFLTLVSGIVLFVVLLRLWPAFKGRVSATTPTSMRLYRWNTYVSPHIEKYLEAEVLIASTGCFKSGKTGVELSMSTWSMQPTVITDVDFVAIADPDGDNGHAVVLGFVRAQRLRALLGGTPEGQSILGHRVWTYVYPAQTDHEALRSELMTPAVFKTEYGLDMGPTDKGDLE